MAGAGQNTETVAVPDVFSREEDLGSILSTALTSYKELAGTKFLIRYSKEEDSYASLYKVSEQYLPFDSKQENMDVSGRDYVIEVWEGLRDAPLDVKTGFVVDRLSLIVNFDELDRKRFRLYSLAEVFGLDGLLGRRGLRDSDLHETSSKRGYGRESLAADLYVKMDNTRTFIEEHS